MLARNGGGASARSNVVEVIERQTAQAEAEGFDLDAALDESDLALPPAPPSPVTMSDLEQVIGRLELMPPDAELNPLGHWEYGLRMAGMTEFVRVTTHPAYFEEHSESVELWSPGSAVFKAPEVLGESGNRTAKRLRDIP